MDMLERNMTGKADWEFWSWKKVDFFHLRALFLLVGPQEISSQISGRNDSQIPDYFIDTIPVFMVVCFVEFLATYYLTGQLMRINDTITSWSSGILSHMTKLCLKSLELGIYTWIFANYRFTTLTLDTWPAWIAAILVTDFGYYWFHRASHIINILWAAHQVHHSSEEFNLSVALRQSVISHLFAWIFYLPLAFLGFSPVAFLVHYQFNLLNLDFLELFLNTPSHHRAHHGRNPIYIDVNFGGVLIIWDRLFGTFAPEDSSEPAFYGLVGRLTSHNALQVQVTRLTEILRRMRVNTTFSDKISAALKGPRWRPGLPFFGILQVVPIHEKEKDPPPEYIYNPKIPTWMTAYATVHFFAVLPFFVAMVTAFARGPRWSGWETAVTFLHVGTSLSFIGSVFDNKPWIPLAETIRCGILAITLAELPGMESEMTSDRALVAMRILFVASLCYWPIHALLHSNDEKPKDLKTN